MLANKSIIFEVTIEETFELKKGWTLKSNQKSVKRMIKTVKSYTEGYFIVGNMNRIDRMTAKNMVEQLSNMGEIQGVSELTKVASWIT